VTDAIVLDAVRDTAWTTNARGERVLAPEGLYGRRKMTAYVRRTAVPDASAGAVDRAMRTLGLEGVRRIKKVRTTIADKDGKRAGDLLDRDFTAPAPNRVWVTDFQCRRRPWISYADLWTMPTFVVTGCGGAASLAGWSA
jgi:transposase InsO family protein